jgi:acyl-CoA thioesterase FadM
VEVNFHRPAHPGPTLSLTAWPESIDTSQIIVRSEIAVDQIDEGNDASDLGSLSPSLKRRP